MKAIFGLSAVLCETQAVPTVNPRRRVAFESEKHLSRCTVQARITSPAHCKPRPARLVSSLETSLPLESPSVMAAFAAGPEERHAHLHVVRSPAVLETSLVPILCWLPAQGHEAPSCSTSGSIWYPRQRECRLTNCWGKGHADLPAARQRASFQLSSSHRATRPDEHFTWCVADCAELGLTQRRQFHLPAENGP